MIRLAVLLGCLAPAFAQNWIDLSRAAIVSTEDVPSRMLRDEIEKRTGLRLSITPNAGGTAIAIGRGSALNVRPASLPAEGFSNGVAGSSVYVIGSDARGVLFGVGHLLRKLEMRRGSLRLPAGYAVTTSPETKLRGHQLGYRPKTNSYDGWTIAMWEQYVRDLAVFGTNAVELIPPRSDDAADSPHFPAPPMQMMTDMSRVLDQYGMDVWIWYPALDKDYSDPKTVEFALNEWGEVFRKLSRVDAILVPAGDPGHTPAKILMPFLEKQAANLRRYHPKAQLWLAPQSFTAEVMEDFFAVAAKRPAWLSGVVYGPQTRISLQELRERLPASIPIRHYPDITHTRSAQYPVPDWDVAFAATLGREPVNPRPEDQALIFRRQQKHTMGFIAYSEGCNDDVNKMIWSGLGWKQDTPVLEILRDYARYFIGPDYAESFAQGLLSLERNWRGPAIGNDSIATTLQQFQSMERSATPQMRANWRFQQALYRAYFDAYVQNRLRFETSLEDEALARLRTAASPEAAMNDAESILNRENPAGRELRARVFELAEALFQSIRMQLSVERYQAIAVGRGANLDTVDFPVNNRLWLGDQFARIRRLAPAAEQMKELRRIAEWTNPGPGGFYDDLGNSRRQPHLVKGVEFAEDPQYFRSPLAFFDPRPATRTSWWDQAIALYDLPLRMRYEQLDPSATYRVRVVYGAGPVRLAAGGKPVHDYVEKPYEVLEFALPPESTRSGVLELVWNRPPGVGGAGRGCQVAEVWLIRASGEKN